MGKGGYQGVGKYVMDLGMWRGFIWGLVTWDDRPDLWPGSGLCRPWPLRNVIL